MRIYIFNSKNHGEIMAKILCTHCEKLFSGSPRHKNQMYCNKPGCQKARKAAWQRKKMRTDPDCRLNQKQSKGVKSTLECATEA